MAWTVPVYKRGEVDRAGKALIDPDANLWERTQAWAIIDNWRTAHAYPLNHFQNLLRGWTRQIDPGGIVVQRQKRRHSIELKLRDNPAMQLSQMQDLGGCRAIVGDVEQVRELRKCAQESRTKCELLRAYDYIATPRGSGYRGVHLVYRYFSEGVGSVYNGLRIEVQLRSALQHAWATAVEVAGAFRGEALKSSHGSGEWLEFFRLMGSWIALREDCPTVPQTPRDEEILRQALADLVGNLGVYDLLTGWTASVEAIEQGEIEKAHYYVLSLDTSNREFTTTGFERAQVAEAEELRSKLEREGAAHGVDVVLVSADKLEELIKAYPNYSLDTEVFVHEVMSAIET